VRPARKDERNDGANRNGQAPNQPHLAPLSLLGEPGGHLPLSESPHGGIPQRDYRSTGWASTRGLGTYSVCCTPVTRMLSLLTEGF
jgi:hypothetical protein